MTSRGLISYRRFTFAAKGSSQLSHRLLVLLEVRNISLRYSVRVNIFVISEFGSRLLCFATAQPFWSVFCPAMRVFGRIFKVHRCNDIRNMKYQYHSTSKWRKYNFDALNVSTNKNHPILGTMIFIAAQQQDDSNIGPIHVSYHR